jgi:hypothetical protein
MAYSTINKPTDHFNTVTYTGNGSSNRAVTSGFATDFVWIKNRGTTDDNVLFDKLRGGTKYIYSNATAAESTFSSQDVTFESTGVNVGSYQSINQNSGNIVSWHWLGGGSGSSNTDGSVTTTVSANPTAGFSIVKWDSTSGSDSMGHGLNSAPEIIHSKRLNGAESWSTHTSIVDGSWDYFRLNTTDGKGDSSYTAASNSVFYYNYGSVQNWISYCFHSVKGFSKIGKFTSIGNDDGAFIYTGFKPSLVMIKANVTDGWSNWYMFDNARDHSQLNDAPQYANLSIQDGYYGGTPASNYSQIDMLSTGFKIRRDGNWGVGGSGQECIYMAFAEASLVGTNDVPTTAA